MVQQSEKLLKNSNSNNTPDMSAHHVERYIICHDFRLPSRESHAVFGNAKVVKSLLPVELSNSPPALPPLPKSPWTDWKSSKKKLKLQNNNNNQKSKREKKRANNDFCLFKHYFIHYFLYYQVVNVRTIRMFTI